MADQKSEQVLTVWAILVLMSVPSQALTPVKNYELALSGKRGCFYEINWATIFGDDHQ